MKKKTLLFSNVIGDISNTECINKCRFNEYMGKYLKNNISNKHSLIFINAPGLGNKSNYLPTIINCFKNINIEFIDVLNIDFDTNLDLIEKFYKENENIVYFLMGGNPLSQIQIINKFKIKEKIKDSEELVIGFCAGAINLSKYSLITTDDDFKEATSYIGIGRVDLCIEPHYNIDSDENFMANRNKELLNFSKLYEIEIYAIPDESIIVVEDDNIKEFGKIYHI